MSDRLSEDKLNKLLPCLKPLAEFISVGEKIDRQTLFNITAEMKLKGEELAFAELELWGSILHKCRGKPSNKDVVVAELQNRGIPVFSAILAYESAKPKPLTIEPVFVDFGCLKFGEGASTTLQASGEPIVETIAGSRLKITLLKSGPAKTLVKLQLSSSASGESVTEEIILRCNTGEVKVTVTARWEEERPRLSYCQECKISNRGIAVKSVFWNYRDKQYECLNLKCKATGPELDKLVSPYKRR